MQKLTPYAQSLVDYVCSHTGKTQQQAINWLNEYCPNWKNKKRAN